MYIGFSGIVEIYGDSILNGIFICPKLVSRTDLLSFPYGPYDIWPRVFTNKLPYLLLKIHNQATRGLLTCICLRN